MKGGAPAPPASRYIADEDDDSSDIDISDDEDGQYSEYSLMKDESLEAELNALDADMQS